MSPKDVGIRIRVEKELREAFQGACLAENRHASDVLREFMRSFADRYNGGVQSSLFITPTKTKTRKNRTGQQSLVRKREGNND